MSEEEKEKAIKQYQEKSSSRGVGRVFGVSYQSVLRWAKKSLELTGCFETLLLFQEGDVLELDELWSFVHNKANKCWV